MHKPVFWGWRIVISALLIGVLSGGLFGFGVGAFFLSLEEAFSQGSRAKISLLLGLAQVEGAIMGPVQGYLIDRFGPRPVALAGVAMLGVGWILASAAGSLGVFVVFYLIMALGNGMGLVASPLAAIANWFEKRRGLAFAIGSAGFGLGSVLVPLDHFLIEELGWRHAAQVCGGLILALGLPLALLLRRSPEHYGMLPDGAPAPPAAQAPRPGAFAETDLTVREALTSRSFWLLGLNFSMRSLVISGITVHFLAAMVDKGISAGTGAQLFVLVGVISLPGRLGVGVMTDRYEKRLVSASMSMLIGLSMLVAVWADSVWQVVLFLIVYGIGTGGGGSAMFAIRGEYFGRRAFATISGFSTAMQAGGAVLGSTLAGVTYDRTQSYTVGFLIFAAVSGVAALAIAAATRPIPARLRGKRQGAPGF